MRASASSGVETWSTPCTSQVPSPTTGRPSLSAKRDLGQRPVAAADRHERVGRADDQAVAQLAEPGRDRDVDPAVRGVAVLPGQDPDRAPAPRARAAARRLHHAAEAAGHDDGARGREPGPDLLRGMELVR